MIAEIFAKLYEAYGDQDWWPAETIFEIMVGAVLTQNTKWSNVEKALANLRAHQALNPETMAHIDVETLAAWIRSSGYYRQKAERLQLLSRWFLEQGGEASLSKQKTRELRIALLALKGIGNETADDILLYGFERPVFVVDTYTRRLYSRIGLFSGDESYQELQHMIEISLDYDTELFVTYHGLIVTHAKQHCQKKPVCDGCPLAEMCQFYSETASQ